MKRLIYRFVLSVLIFTTIAYTSEQFNNSIEFSNKWLIITATNKECGKCTNFKELRTELFTGLKSGLFICIADAVDSKEYAQSLLKNVPSGSYIKYSGGYNDIGIKDSSIISKNLFFNTQLNDSVFLQCQIKKNIPDPVQIEQGNTTAFECLFISYKNKKSVDKIIVNVFSQSEWNRIQIDGITTAFWFKENAVDESSLHVLCWDRNGKLKYNDEFFNSVSEGEAEIVTFEKVKQKYAIVITSKNDGQQDKRLEKIWDGSTFK
jgi:hypothetical protein